MSKQEVAEKIEQTVPLLPTNTLDCLRTIDSLYVKQYPSLLEVFCGITSEAKFDVFNGQNQRVFQAIENSTFWQRFCCTTRRRFTLRVLDNFNQEIIQLKREFKCCSGCCWCANCQCCSQEILVESPPGTLIGTVSQQQSGCRMVFALKDANDNHILTLQGPLCICDGPISCCCQSKFRLIGTDGITEVGAVYKKYRGFFHEATSSADAYLLKVPLDLDVKMKAVALGALFLIEFMIFSAAPQRSSGSLTE